MSKNVEILMWIKIPHGVLMMGISVGLGRVYSVNELYGDGRYNYNKAHFTQSEGKSHL